MAEDRMITVAIHTYDRALALKSLLENEGIAVALQNVNLTNPVVASGVRVRIHENDLPLALRLIESAESLATSVGLPENGQKILVPVDFSDHSISACELAFRFASLQKVSIHIIHSFIDPFLTDHIQLSDTLNYDMEETESKINFAHNADIRMERFARKLREKIKAGEIPEVRFTTSTAEGVPEEVINTYAKEHKPMLIVMGTRGAETKERELVGSVTAEVLDSCRIPVFTLPDSLYIRSSTDLKNVLFFCSFDQADLLAMDMLYRMFSSASRHVTLVNIPSKKQTLDVTGPFQALLKYCQEHYPDYTFSTRKLTLKSGDEDFKKLFEDLPIDLIAVPNKKKNIFARLFNPGIAHRILFRSDVPMIGLPV